MNILLFPQINCSEHKNVSLHILPVATLAAVSIRLQFDTTASQTSIQSFSLQYLSLYTGVALLYSAGLFFTSVINLSLSKILKSRSMICALAWNGRRRLVAMRLVCRSCPQAGMFLCVTLPPPTLSGHRTGQKMKRVAFGKTLRWNNRPCARFHLKEKVSFQRPLWLFHRCGKNRSCALALNLWVQRLATAKNRDRSFARNLVICFYCKVGRRRRSEKS